MLFRRAPGAFRLSPGLAAGLCGAGEPCGAGCGLWALGALGLWPTAPAAHLRHGRCGRGAQGAGLFGGPGLGAGGLSLGQFGAGDGASRGLRGALDRCAAPRGHGGEGGGGERAAQRLFEGSQGLGESRRGGRLRGLGLSADGGHEALEHLAAQHALRGGAAASTELPAGGWPHGTAGISPFGGLSKGLSKGIWDDHDFIRIMQIMMLFVTQVTMRDHTAFKVQEQLATVLHCLGQSDAQSILEAEGLPLMLRAMHLFPKSKKIQAATQTHAFGGLSRAFSAENGCETM